MPVTGWKKRWLTGASALLLLAACQSPDNDHTPVDEGELCGCKPRTATREDWRRPEKDEAMPSGSDELVTVGAILRWEEGRSPARDAPRQGRELQIYRLRGHLQAAFLRASDCDFHLEISESADQRAPRVLVEIPAGGSYCTPRRELFSALAHQGFHLTHRLSALSPPLPVEVRGLAFRDRWHPFWYPRASRQVKTLWELHPAEVTLLP